MDHAPTAHVSWEDEAGAAEAIRNVFGALDGELKLDAVSPNGSYKFIAEREEKRFVVKALCKDDLPWARNIVTTIASVPHIVPQTASTDGGYSIIWREFVKTTMTAESLTRIARDADRNPTAAAQTVRGFIRALLMALDSLHSNGFVHGVLQPDRIAVDDNGEVNLRDIAVPSVFSGTYVRQSNESQDGFYSRARYVAPERISQPEAIPTQSSDIYSVLSIALDILRPYRGSRAAASLSELDARIRWIKEFSSPEVSRPTAAELLSLLFDEQPAQGRKLGRRAEAKGSSPRWPKRTSTSWQKIISGLADFPETAIALEGKGRNQRLANLHQIVSARKHKSARRPRAHASPTATTLTSEPGTSSKPDPEGFFSKDSFRAEIDRLWLDSLHHLHFGFPFDDEHDFRVAATDLRPDDLIAQDHFRRSVSLANSVRRELLDSFDFLTTRGVIRELQSLNAKVSRNEVLVARRWGVILAVPDSKRWLYPSFQFHDGTVNPFIKRSFDRHRLLRNGLPPNPWSELDFFNSRYASLDGETLREHIWTRERRNHIKRIIDNVKV